MKSCLLSAHFSNLAFSASTFNPAQLLSIANVLALDISGRGIPSYVNNLTGAAGNDFYFVRHNGSASNPIELSDVTNTVVATPEVLTVSANNTSYFIDGDIDVQGDIDHYSVAVPANLTANTVSVVCSVAPSFPHRGRPISAILFMLA